MKYKLTIAGAALDENPGVHAFDDWYEMQDFLIEECTKQYGADYSEDDFDQFMQLVRLEEIDV